MGDLTEFVKILSNVQNTTPPIPKEISDQYPYGEFPVRYTKSGQELLRKNSERRYSYKEEDHSTYDTDTPNDNSGILTILPLLEIMMSKKKQPNKMFELFSSILFKDKPELKKLFSIMPNITTKEVSNCDNFPDTNKVSISSLRRLD